MPFSSSRIVKAAFHDMPLCLHNYTGFCFYASSLAWLTFYIKVIFGHNLAITYLNFKLSWIYFQLFNHPKEPNTQMRACARTHTHTLSLFLPAPYCQFIDVLFSCRPLFVSGVCFVTVVVSPCRVQRIRLSTLLPLALNTAPRYCLLLALALLLSALFSSFPLKLINAFLSPAHFLMSRPCWRAVLVQFCTNCAGSPKPMCVLLIFAVNKLESNLTKN